MSFRCSSRRLAVAVSFALASTQTAFAANPFTIAVLPDTQYYSQNDVANPSQSLFHDQVNWILQNRNAHNIVFTTHLGDVVNTAGQVGNPTGQWAVAQSAMSALKNSTMPFNILPGNHEWTSASGAGSIEHYRSRFGDQANYFAGKSWFKGYDERGINSAVLFDTPAGPMLNLSLEFNATSPTAIAGAPASPIAWAQRIINENPGVPTIISTHNAVNPGQGRDGFGQSLFKQLVRDNNQVFLVMNGHYNGNDNEQDLTSLNRYGRAVYELASDYQNNANGGDGWMRLLTFDPDAKMMKVTTYSPKNNADLSGDAGGAAGAAFNHVGTVRTDYDSAFTREIDFGKRFAPTRTPIATNAKTLQNGLGGYAGTKDTALVPSTPDTVLNRATVIDIDADTLDTADSQGLIRFDGIFGAGANQVAADRDVMRATLRVYVDTATSAGPGSGVRLFRMLQGWDESTATYNSLGAGITANGIEAFEVEEDAAGASNGSDNIKAGTWVELDVTRSLQAMRNGAANHGWALLPYASGTNAVRFSSSEAANAAYRPQLVLDTTSAPVQAKSFKNGAAGYEGATSTWIDQASPNEANGSDPILRIDAGTSGDPNGPDQQTLLRFDDLIGDGESQVPGNGVRISSAILKLNVPDITNADGGGFTIHRMLRDWNGQSTWASLGNGIELGTDASAVPDDRIGMDTLDASVIQAGVLYIDVSASLRAWAEEGETNFGWALLPLPSSTNAIFFDGANSAGFKPELIVRYLTLGESNWSATTGGDWSTLGNWNDFDSPNRAGRTAHFGRSITGDAEIRLDADKTVGTLRFDAEHAYRLAGPGTLSLARDAGEGVIEVVAGHHQIQSSVSLLASTRVDVASNASLVLDDVTGQPLTKRGAGELLLNDVGVDALSIEVGAVRFTSARDAVQHVGALSIAEVGLLDLSTALLVVDGANASVSQFDGLRQAAREGRMTGVDDERYGVAVVLASSVGGLTVFGEAGTSGDAILIGSMLKGDATLNDAVGFDDLLILAQHYGIAEGATWSDGDFTADGAVGFGDLLALAQNYGVANAEQFAVDWQLAQAMAAQPVPEPMALSAAAALLGLRGRGRRGR